MSRFPYNDKICGRESDIDHCCYISDYSYKRGNYWYNIARAKSLTEYELESLKREHSEKEHARRVAKHLADDRRKEESARKYAEKQAKRQEQIEAKRRNREFDRLAKIEERRREREAEYHYRKTVQHTRSTVDRYNDRIERYRVKAQKLLDNIVMRRMSKNKSTRADEEYNFYAELIKKHTENNPHNFRDVIWINVMANAMGKPCISRNGLDLNYEQKSLLELFVDYIQEESKLKREYESNYPDMLDPVSVKNIWWKTWARREVWENKLLTSEKLNALYDEERAKFLSA